MNENLAKKSELLDYYFPVREIKRTGTTELFFAGHEKLESMKKTLSMFSNDHLEDFEWQITMPSSGKSGIIRFPTEANYRDDLLLKLSVLDSLLENTSIPLAKRIVREGKLFLHFLDSKHLDIFNCTTGMLDLYKKYLDNQTYKDGTKNYYYITAVRLVRVCIEQGWIKNRFIDASGSWMIDAKPKRAPEINVIHELDIIFFDINEEIPNEIRLIYLLCRMIPNRIGEILSMKIDCLTFISPEVFCITIPTFKNTLKHVPSYAKYYRKSGGWAEGILCEMLQRQIKVATSLQESVCGGEGEYLFVQPTKPYKCVSAKRFNAFLRNVCDDRNIRQSDGSIAAITSHDIRHGVVVERLRNGVDVERVQKECNHMSADQTMWYSRLSVADEVRYSEEINALLMNASNVRDELNCEPVVVDKRLFDEDKRAPFTRMLPTGDLCKNVGCAPQYTRCIRCENFEPDPKQLDKIEDVANELKIKISGLKRHGVAAKAAVEFNSTQLKLMQEFIKRVRGNE